MRLCYETLDKLFSFTIRKEIINGEALAAFEALQAFCLIYGEKMRWQQRNVSSCGYVS